MAVRSGGATKRTSNRAVIAEQTVAAYEMRLSGMLPSAIAKVLKVSESTVRNRINTEIAKRVLPLADEVRKMELDRLDRWLSKLDDQIEGGHMVARNVEVAVKVSERRAKLLGVDAPEKQEIMLTELSAADVALAELVNEANAAAAVTEARLRAE